MDPGSPALRYRIPSSPMPRATLRQPDGGQPAPPDQTELRQRVHRVLTTGWGEAACRQSQWRHHVPVKLDNEDQPPDDRRLGASYGLHAPRRYGIHRFGPAASIRRKPARSSSPSLAETTSRLLGSARITMCSDRPHPSITSRATWRSRRDSRWRCTADPTDRETISPSFGLPVARRI